MLFVDVQSRNLRRRFKKLRILSPKIPKSIGEDLQLENTESQDLLLPTSVKNSTGALVDGTQASDAWKDSFSKLGLEATDMSDFDSKFYLQIKQSVEEHQALDSDHNPALDQPISLEEVKTALEKRQSCWNRWYL